ncbi:MAG: BREX system P-loop protein BrxC [Deltaproteobacteria bacterium]|nr:BREX system P-loop protein BrxC [Deltaproteobacteria bacterium]
MKTKEIFLKDPLAWKLVNEGVSSNNTEDLATLRYELESFVCEGEYLNGMRRILQGYRDSFKSPEQKAAWISGFYGSGKSHLAKVLRYLWINFAFPDGTTARSLAHLPEEITDLLTEISTLGKRHEGLHMAGGTLKAGAGSVRLRVMSLFFKSVGLPEGYPYAKFLIHLKRDGKFDDFKKAIEDQGKDFDKELGRLYTSGAVAKAYVQCHDHLNDHSQVGALLMAEYPDMKDVSIDEMLNIIREAIAANGKLPCTLLVLDEIQAFVGQDVQLSEDVREVTEALSKEMDGRLMIVGLGQSALNDTSNLQKLMGRFTIKIHLKDNDVEKVVRSVVLQKREDKKAAIKQLIDKNEGEITRQLKATKLASQSEDDLAYIPDFPLLPVRRRFWERVLHSVDSTGTSSQMRTQLRVVHEACCAYANAELGAVVPGDFLYDQIANGLVSTGEMQKRFQEIIEQQKTKPDGALRSRICALVFLINKLPREHGTDLGVRAEPEHLADLLSEDLITGSTQLRQQIPGLLAAMDQDDVLMKVDSEYHLQTTEGAAWEAERRKRRAAALNDQPLIASTRSQLLDKALTNTLGNPSVLHGDAKERRKVVIHHGESKPEATDAITLWVRDGFSALDSSVLADIRKLSTDDPTLHLFLPKSHAKELESAIASFQAAEETLNFKGNPTSQEGKECRQSMVTKQNAEGLRVDELIGQILGGARLFLSGGQEQSFIGLKEGVEDAARQVLNRLYPKFHDGDSAKWPQVLKKAKDGSPSALEQVGFTGDPQNHPVAAAIISFIGAGKTGLEIRKKFTGVDYGWPQDAIDAVLTTLLASNHLSARINANPLMLADVDQKKLGQAAFRIESPVLTAVQKLAIRKLFQEAGLSKITPGNESGDVLRFVEHAKAIAAQAGGDAPAPMAPAASEITALESYSGNDLLMELHDQRDALLAKIKTWQATGKEITRRLPAFVLTEKLVAQAVGLAEQAEWSANLIAIRANRSLLDDPDPVSHVLKAAANALRAGLTHAHKAHAAMFVAQAARISSNAAWQKLPEEKRQSLLSSAGALQRTAPATGSDEQLLSALQSCSLANWQSQTDALAAQFDKALAAAIIEAEPKARRVTLAAATIHDEAELDAWLNKSKHAIEAALKDGPVIL